MNSVLLGYLRYWCGLGGGERVPARHSLDLRELPDALPWMFIANMTADGSLAFSLAGSAVQSAMGTGIINRNYGDMFDNSVDDGLGVEMYTLAIVRGCGLYRCGALTLNGQDYQSFEVLALPFADDRALGGTIMVAAIGPIDAEDRDLTSGTDNIHLDLKHMFMIPSPSFIKAEQIPAKLQKKISDQHVQPKVMDLDGFLSKVADDKVLVSEDIPSHSLESASKDAAERLN